MNCIKDIKYYDIAKAYKADAKDIAVRVFNEHREM